MNMKSLYSIRVTALSMAVILFLSSCSSSTIIRSEPPGARVYLNGQEVGKTPYTMTDEKIVGSKTILDLKLEGYEPFYTTIIRNEDLDVGALIGGIFVWIPLLWIMKYQPDHKYQLIEKLTPAKQFQNEFPTTGINISSKEDRLRLLKDLFEKKLITQEDYDKQRQKILDEKD